MAHTNPHSISSSVEMRSAPDGLGTIERLLTYRETANLLGVSERTVWTLVQDGLLHAVKVGRSVRVAPADLRSFIERSRVGRLAPGSAA